MAGEFGKQETFTLQAAVDLSAARYHVARVSAAQTCNIASLATDDAIVGVIQNKAESGERVTIADGGTTKVVAGAAVTVNALLTTNGSGRAVAASSGDYVIGRALDAVSGNGDVLKMRLYKPTRWGAI